jgi:hypothetical protein
MRVSRLATRSGQIQSQPCFQHRPRVVGQLDEIGAAAPRAVDWKLCASWQHRTFHWTTGGGVEGKGESICAILGQAAEGLSEAVGRTEFNNYQVSLECR